MAPACWALRLLAASGLQTVCKGNPPTAHPQGLGPQHLWPTPAVLVVPGNHAGWARWHTELAKYVRLQAARHGANGAWRYPGGDFLESCRSAGGPLAVAAKHLQRFVEARRSVQTRPAWERKEIDWYGCGAASYDQYFRKALGREPSLVQRLHLSVKESWASAASAASMPWQEPHVHPKVALSGAFYLESLRKKLGWGEASQVRLRAGSLLLHPAWLYHAGLPLSDALESSNDTEASRAPAS
eukprot:s1055_g4.t1